MRAPDCVNGDIRAAERAGFRGRGGGLILFLMDELGLCRRHELDNEENCERYYKKVEHGLNEIAVVERRKAGLGRERGGSHHSGIKARLVAENDEHVLETAAACDEADERHDEVGDERGDDLAERAADNNADGHVNDVAF